MTSNKQLTLVRCFYCEKVVNFKKLDLHFCFKGDITDYYFDTAFPDSVFVNNGIKYVEIPWQSFNSIRQTPKLNTKKNNDSDPDNLPVLDLDFC